MLQLIVVLVTVMIDFPDPRVVIKLDKRVMLGTMVLNNEFHHHEVLSSQTMADGLDNLEDYLTTNGWPNISAQDRALLLNVTNAARGATEQSPIQQL